jgi:hypothetical protein
MASRRIGSRPHPMLTTWRIRTITEAGRQDGDRCRNRAARRPSCGSRPNTSRPASPASRRSTANPASSRPTANPANLVNLVNPASGAGAACPPDRTNRRTNRAEASRPASRCGVAASLRASPASRCGRSRASPASLRASRGLSNRRPNNRPAGSRPASGRPSNHPSNHPGDHRNNLSRTASGLPRSPSGRCRGAVPGPPKA